MKNIESYGYTVISKDNDILKELIDLQNEDNNIINWFNFNQGDIYIYIIQITV